MIMQMKTWTLIIPFLLLPINGYSADLPEVNKSNFENHGKEKAVVIMHINWERAWGCAKNDNAQLTDLKFKKIGNGETPGDTPTLMFETPSKLAPKEGFQPYVLLIDPGKYALSGFSVKVAKTKTDIGYLKADENHLIESDNAIGGSFSVSEGEIVYLGHIALDCAQEPIPWRYYIEGKNQFAGYTEGLKSEYPYFSGRKLLFRIIDTTKFGQPYSLGKSYGVQM